MGSIISIANQDILYRFRFPDTERYLRSFIREGETRVTKNTVSVTEQEYSDWGNAGNKIDAFAEFCLLCQQTSEYLLPFDKCIFHAVAISFADHAWLISAGSGVGKSTLCKSLTDTYPEEITVINGDKPALHYEAEKGITVYPSPWNGKEGAVMRIYQNVFQSYNNAVLMRAAGKMTENIMRSVPVWLLTTKQVPETRELVYRKLQEVRHSEL